MSTDHIKTVAEIAWFNYFNEYLFKNNVITEAERNKMAILISDRNHASTRSCK